MFSEFAMALPFILFSIICAAGGLILGYYIGLAENDKDRKVLTSIQTYCLQLRPQMSMRSVDCQARASVANTILSIMRKRNEIPKYTN